MIIEEVRRKIQAAIAESDELLTLVKKRKLRWFGHGSSTVFWFSTDNPTGNSERTKKKRQTKEQMGRQYQRVDMNELGQLN